MLMMLSASGMGLESKSWTTLLPWILFLVLYFLFFLPFDLSMNQITQPNFLLCGIILCLPLYSWSLEQFVYMVIIPKIYQSEIQSISLCQSVIACNPFFLFLLFSVLVFSLCCFLFWVMLRGLNMGPLLWTPPTLKYISCLLPLRDICHSTYAIVLTYSDTQNSTECRPWPLPSPL